MRDGLHMLIALAPAFALIVCLMFKRFPGEEAINRIAIARAERRKRAPISVGAPRLARLQPASYVCGGLLIAMNRANRPPPLLLA